MRRTRLAVLTFLIGLASFWFCHVQSMASSPGGTRLEDISNGGFIRLWLVSNTFPAEIDAGMWENFNRFNVETLPRKDWLRPFGGISGVSLVPGKLEASVSGRSDEAPDVQNPSLRADLPEVGEVSNAKPLPDASEMSWSQVQTADRSINFFQIAGGKAVGTSYAAAVIVADADAKRFIDTDGFLGAVWLNGKKIYDGYSLDVKRTAVAEFKKGANRLVVRASGVSGDYWRRDGGWIASLRFWNTAEQAASAAAFKPSGVLGTIFYLEGFHVDPVYLQDQRGYSKVTLSNVSQYMQSLRADRRYGVYLSEIDYLKPYLDTHPEDREFIRQAVADGRVGSGGAYNQPNPMNTGGEAFIRNIMYGQYMHEAILGRRAKSLALWDVFGHIPQLSQIVNKSGFTGVTWSKKITGFQPFFYDYALDGSRALHRRLDYAYSFSGFGSGKNYSFDNFRRMTERKFEEPRSFGSSVDVRINAADFTPPWTNLAGNVKTLDEQKPRILVSGQAQDMYFDALGKEVAEGKVKPPLTSRDKLFFHVGVMMARSDLKVAHRLTENMTLTAEKFGSLAYILGANYPDLALDKAWRHILFNSHHDAITGTPSDSAMLDLINGYREAFDLSRGALNDSLNFIAGKVDTRTRKDGEPGSVPVVVFNPMNWTRTDLVRVTVNFPNEVAGVRVRDPKGSVIVPRVVRWNGRSPEIEFVATDVPSMGYRTFQIEPVSGRSPVDSGAQQALENEYYRITIDANRGGAITSIFDKQAKREVINTANGRLGNEIAILREELTKKNVTYPAWELWTTGEKKFSSEVRTDLVYEAGGDTQTLRVEGQLPNKTRFRQTISLHKGIKRIDFKTEILDYRGKDELFTVNFPLNLKGGALVTEDRFGTVVRNGSKGFLDYRTNTDKLVSGSPVYGVYNWAGYGSTLNLSFNDGGKEAASVPFKPTALVRPHGETFEKATETLVSTLITRGVSVTPFYDDNDAERRSKLTIEDSTMPKSLNDDIAYHGFRISLGGENENAYSAKLLKAVTPATKAAFEARLARDGYAFLFLYDKDVPQGWNPLPVLLMAGNVEAAAEKIATPIRSGAFSAQPSSFKSEAARKEYANLDTFKISIPLETFALETNPGPALPKVPDFGVELINKGTPAVSLENPDTLTLLLTHTAMFPGVNLPFEWVPENKTHVFEYALYPHSGSWREANATRAGYEFNNPLIAVQSNVKAGPLPTEMSLIGPGRGNLVISALKLGGNPQANFFSKASDEALSYPYLQLEGSGLRPLILRAYETEGRVAAGGIETAFDVTGREVGLLEQEGVGSGAGFLGRSVGSLTSFNAFEIRTFELFVKRQSTDGPALGATRERIQPIYSRYWLHNAGVAPIGNDVVKVSLRPVEQMGALSSFSWDDPYNQGGLTTTAVRVQVVNNYQDRAVKGTVKLEVPSDWRVVPDTLDYEIGPNGSFVKDVVVLTYPVKKNEEWERSGGLVKAFIEHDGQRFYDVLQIGKPFKLEWKTEVTDKEVLVTVRNPHRQSIEGALAMIKPYEAWIFSPSQSQREIGFSVPARGEIVLSFPKDEVDGQSWTVARLVYNGWLEYLRADGRNTK